MTVPRSSSLVGAALLGLACVPIPLEQVYDTAPQICSDPELFEELLADCRARWESEGSCAGVFGFEGTLDGHAVRVATEFERATLVDVASSMDERLRWELRTRGASPFFSFELNLHALGGSVGALAEPELVEIVEQDVSLANELARLDFSIEAPRQRGEFVGVRGELETRARALEEHAGRFVVEFDTEDTLEGCFHALATRTELLGPGDAP